jgi:tRNA threonylcarbamoyladenosine biosynthesis protein TsaB
MVRRLWGASPCGTVDRWGWADNLRMHSSPLQLLAIETSTDTLSVAVGLWTDATLTVAGEHTGPGAAQASATLLPTVQSLLARAALPLHTLDAIVFARGPGSFTGLRTTCAVAQGLAYGAQGAGRLGGVPLLPVDTLLALAETARHQRTQAGLAMPKVIAALLDARMDEMYLAVYACGPAGLALQPLQPPRLCAPADLGHALRHALPAGLSLEAGDCLLAGNVFSAYGAQFSDLPGERETAWPTAAALLRSGAGLAGQRGSPWPAQDALPLYVRDKVAQTTAEREQLAAGTHRTAWPGTLPATSAGRR